MNQTDQVKRQETADTPTGVRAASAIDEAKQRIAKLTRTGDDGERTIPQALHDTFRDERNDVMQVINELEDQLDRHQEMREALERELTQANDKLQVATQRIQELDWQTVTLQARVEGLEQVRQEVTLLEEEVANANGRIQRLNEEYSAIERERARLRNELKAANKQLEELWAVRKERDGLRTDIKGLTSRIDELERAQRDTVEERTQTQARLQDLQVALEQAHADRHQHQIVLRAAEDRARELARIQEELADKLEATRGDKRNLQAQIAHLERENARLVEQRQFYETELASLRSMNRNAEAALASVKKAFAEVRVALTETKSRARRRMIETWPRIDVSLRGIEKGEPTTAETGALETIAAGIAPSERTTILDGAPSDDDNGHM